MTDRRPHNLVASVRQRLMNMARERREDFDLWALARTFEFEGPMLCRAIQATFERRRTSLPTTTPLALTPEFAENRTKMTQWGAFLSKGNLAEQRVELSVVIAVLEPFLMPPTVALVAGQPLPLHWRPSGKWETQSDT